MAKEKLIPEAEDKESELKSCFIITPIGILNSEINLKAFGLITAVMEPVLADFKYKPIAANNISLSGSINKQILKRLTEDELVIANLTGLNPNVMYELAVRHAVRKPVIIMAENDTKLPFDIVDQRCIFYENSLHGVEPAKDALRNFLSNVLTEEINNPIYDSIAESQIIKNNDSAALPFQYLLQRFDRLERFIQDNGESRSINIRERYPINRTSMVEFVVELFNVEDNGESAFKDIVRYFMTLKDVEIISSPVLSGPLITFIIKGDDSVIDNVKMFIHNRGLKYRVHTMQGLFEKS